MTVLRCSHAVKAGLLELPVGETGEQRLYSFWWQQRVDEAKDSCGTWRVALGTTRAQGAAAGQGGQGRECQGAQGVDGVQGAQAKHTRNWTTVGWAEDGQQYGLNWSVGWAAAAA